MLYGVRSCFGLEIFCCSRVLASCVIMGNSQGTQVNTDQIAAAVGASVAAALGAMQQQAPAQAVPPAQVPHPPVPFPPPPPQIPPPAAAVDDPRVPPNVAPPPHYPPGDFGQGPVGESHFLRPCRFCGHTSYWREGVCLSEWCRASWLSMFFLVKMSVCCALRLATATRTWT